MPKGAMVHDRMADAVRVAALAQHAHCLQPRHAFTKVQRRPLLQAHVECQVESSRCSARCQLDVLADAVANGEGVGAAVRTGWHMAMLRVHCVREGREDGGDPLRDESVHAHVGQDHTIWRQRAKAGPLQQETR